VLATKVDFGTNINLAVAMFIAVIKATLVVLFFMHLKYDKVFHTVIFVRRLLYFTCMKNSTTSVALVMAMPMATGKLNDPRLTNATPTVAAVNTISAEKMP